ncbi:MAG TPA: hypothetical protein RMH99_32345 [Sandaracinaceae bacterium LLY-WYZ-13_1]|nr:hypothetical protein [Sandaracinaceae bacterium LLY-WYZ-13_1]
MLPAPTTLCLACRALSDGPRCDCARPHPSAHVPLDEAAADRIDEAILHDPERDTEDVVTRLVFGVLIGPAPIAMGLWLIAVILYPFWPAIEHLWPWVFALPLGVATLGWIAFVAWTTLAQYPYYLPADRPPQPRGEPIEGRLDRGAVVHVAELHPDEARGRVLLRDAFAPAPFVIRRSGERIELPAGRLRVDVPPHLQKEASSALTESWRTVPPTLRTAGRHLSLTLDEGDPVSLVGGDLEELERAEGGFRESADRRFRWVGERPCLVVR